MASSMPQQTGVPAGNRRPYHGMIMATPAPWKLLLFLITVTVHVIAQEFDSDTGYPCSVPLSMHGSWYSFEDGEGVDHLIEEQEMNKKGRCIGQRYYDIDSVYRNFFLFETFDGLCQTCVGLFYRTRNVLEYKETSCQSTENKLSIQELCNYIEPENIILTTMFAKSPRPNNCRQSFEGVYTFCYEKEDGFAGKCCNPYSNITSCQRPGTFFEIENQRFGMTWKPCAGNSDSFDQEIKFQCLGDWILDNGNRYIAVANMGEDQKHLKYRCFLTRRDQPLLMSMSWTATCNTLKNAKQGPIMIDMREVQSKRVNPGCKFPANFTGRWVNTANYDSAVKINATHIKEVSQPDQQQPIRTYYVCQESRDSRYMVAKLGVGGCQVDYICFDFLARHQNVIRYRKGRAFIDGEFRSVCAWSAFDNSPLWKYSTFLLESPYGVTCPILGKYRFRQDKGDGKLVKKVEVTDAPRERIDCLNYETAWGACATAETRIDIDVDRCATLDHRGKPIGIYDIIDYKLMCIGFWKEDDKSYLVTFNEQDPYSKYQCWVYRRIAYDRLRLSKAVKSRCHVNQTDESYSARDGSNLLLELVENERRYDNCPLAFDDGANPYKEQPHTHFFSTASSKHHHLLPSLILICILLANFS